MNRRTKQPRPAASDLALIEHFAKSGIDKYALSKLLVKRVLAGAATDVRLPVDGACIPYFDLDGNPIDFRRYRLLGSWTPDGAEKPLRYLQAAKSGNHFYFPPLMSQPWRVIASDTSIPLLITEGEKKAACACINGYPCIGLGGVWNWRSDRLPIPDFDLVKWVGRRVYLVFDSPDVQTNSKVTAALERLAAELRGRGAEVRIVVLPVLGNTKVGLDDFIVANGTAALDPLLGQAPKYLDAISEMNEQFASVWLGAKALILKESRRADGTVDVAFATPAEVRPGLAHRHVQVGTAIDGKRMPLFDFWMQSPRRRQFDRVVFEPSGCPPSDYNLWRGFAIKPVPGDCHLFLAHVEKTICSGDPELYRYVLSWCAHMVQRPDELPGTALVLRSGQGTGKGFFVQALGALLGSHYIQMSSAKQLLGNFNAHTKDKLLYFLDEALWAGDKAAEGTLKALITEPTRMVEPKGKDAFLVSNHAHVVIASNNLWVVPAGMDDRRFVITDVCEEHKQDTAYFSALRAELDNGGLSALLHYLLNYDISDFNPRKFPKTPALLETKLLSLPPVQRFWYECLWCGDNGGPGGGWSTEVSCANLHGKYLEFGHSHGDRRRAAQTELGRALKKMVPGLSTIRRRGAGMQSNHWIFPDLVTCREAFCDSLGQEIDWDIKAIGEKSKRGRK